MHPPEAIFFDLSFQDGKTLSFLEFIQDTFPKISIFTVVRPEQRAWADKSLETAVQGCLSTPVDYRGVKNLLAGASACKQRPTYRRSNPASTCCKLVFVLVGRDGRGRDAPPGEHQRTEVQYFFSSFLGSV